MIGTEPALKPSSLRSPSVVQAQGSVPRPQVRTEENPLRAVRVPGGNQRDSLQSLIRWDVATRGLSESPRLLVTSSQLAPEAADARLSPAKPRDPLHFLRSETDRNGVSSSSERAAGSEGWLREGPVTPTSHSFLLRSPQSPPRSPPTVTTHATLWSLPPGAVKPNPSERRPPLHLPWEGNRLCTVRHVQTRLFHVNLFFVTSLRNIVLLCSTELRKVCF